MRCVDLDGLAGRDIEDYPVAPWQEIPEKAECHGGIVGGKLGDGR